MASCSVNLHHCNFKVGAHLRLLNLLTFNIPLFFLMHCGGHSKSKWCMQYFGTLKLNQKCMHIVKHVLLHNCRRKFKFVILIKSEFNFRFVVVFLSITFVVNFYADSIGIYATSTVIESVRKAQEQNSSVILSRALRLCKDKMVSPLWPKISPHFHYNWFIYVLFVS